MAFILEHKFPEPQNIDTRIYEKSDYDFRMNLKSGDTVFYPDKDSTVVETKVKEVLGKQHGAGIGYSLSIILENSISTSSVKVFKSKEDVEKLLAERIIEDERLKQRKEWDLQIPMIKNVSHNLLSDDITSFNPLMKPNDPIFIKD